MPENKNLGEHRNASDAILTMGTRSAYFTFQGNIWSTGPLCKKTPKTHLRKRSNGENRYFTFSPTFICRYITNTNQSHPFCIPVLLLFYKLLPLLICYDILAIENYSQCRTDDWGSRNHLQAWLFLPLNMLKRFLVFKGKGVSFSISKKGWTTYCNLCKLYVWKDHTWYDVWQDHFWQIQTTKIHVSGCNAPDEVWGQSLDWPQVLFWHKLILMLYFAEKLRRGLQFSEVHVREDK